MTGLKEKIAIVTGGARGIGKAIARRLAKEGVLVTIVNTRPETAQKALEQFANEGLTATSAIANVADYDEVQQLFKSVLDRHGRVDILINNAGVVRDNFIVRMKPEEWSHVVDTNLKGTFHCIKAVSKPMMKARYGRIINISSVVGIVGNAGQANYSASKAGIIGLTKTSARELASRNINVNAVNPGFIETEMTNGLGGDAKSAFMANIPLGRPGHADEVAAAVCFLASDEASYITGQAINVDGGMVMQ